ncbi:MAG: hypothetical protein KGN84_21575, partial [Acidobacteriota bacterium]|nr:hypothetical protein [Acidobacteriota bacterium]
RDGTPQASKGERKRGLIRTRPTAFPRALMDMPPTVKGKDAATAAGVVGGGLLGHAITGD